METKVVKWKKGDKAGEMERWRKASGEEEGGGEGKKNACRSEERKESKAKARSDRSKATEKSRGAVTRQVPSSGF